MTDAVVLCICSSSLFNQPDRRLKIFLCFRATVCKTVRLMPSDRCLSACLSVCLSVCVSVGLGILVYCVQTVERIKMPVGTEVGLGPGDTVLERGTAAPPTFRPMSIVVKRLDGSRCHLVLW